MVSSCLLVVMTFLSSYEHTATNGWFFYNFTQNDGKQFLVHTWVEGKDNKLVKLLISRDPSLKILPGREILKKTQCMENSAPYTAYEVLIPRGAK